MSILKKRAPSPTESREDLLAVIARVSAALEAAGQKERAAEWRGRALECSSTYELFQMTYECQEAGQPYLTPTRQLRYEVARQRVLAPEQL